MPKPFAADSLWPNRAKIASRRGMGFKQQSASELWSRQLGDLFHCLPTTSGQNSGIRKLAKIQNNTFNGSPTLMKSRK